MAEETTQQFLARRKKELLAQISALKGQLAPKEAELAQITKFEASQMFTETPIGVPYEDGNALAALSTSTAIFDALGPDKTNALVRASEAMKLTSSSISAALAESSKSVTLAGSAMSEAISQAMGNTASLRFAHMTIKQMIVQALLDHFPKGATAADIREYIRDGYGRTVDPSSLRPQMHRLKSNAVLVHDSQRDVWDLSKLVRKNLAFPHARRGLSELKDEPIGVADEQLQEAGVIPPGASSIRRGGY